MCLFLLFVNPYKVPNSLTSSEYGGRLEEEFEEMDDMDEEMDGWIDKDEETGDNLFSVPVDVEEELWDSFESSLQFPLLFPPVVDIENGPMGSSTNSTRTVPEDLWRGEGLSSGSVLPAAT